MGRRVRLQQSETKTPKQPVIIRRKSVSVLLPDIRRTALRLAKGDVARIEVISPTEAVVHNGTDHRIKRRRRAPQRDDEVLAY